MASPQQPDVVFTPTIAEAQSTLHLKHNHPLATTRYSHPDLGSDDATLVALAVAKQEHSRYQPLSKSSSSHSRRCHHRHRNHCRHGRKSRRPSKGSRIVYAIIAALVLMSLAATCEFYLHLRSCQFFYIHISIAISIPVRYLRNTDKNQTCHWSSHALLPPRHPQPCMSSLSSPS